MISGFSSVPPIQLPSLKGAIEKNNTTTSEITQGTLSTLSSNDQNTVDQRVTGVNRASEQFDQPNRGENGDNLGQANQLTPEEQKTVQELKARDIEVRAHEQAHAAVGGQYAGSPQYDYQTGPDGKRYAVGGSVSIDVSAESDPKATIQKMQIVKRAAMAPAEPSAQDYKVAAAATQKEQEARAELSKQNGPNAESSSSDSNATNAKEKNSRGDSVAIQKYNAVYANNSSSSLSIFA